MRTDGGGWAVFQRRQDGSVDFYRGWSDYKAGFGQLTAEFWLGNDKIHRLTASRPSSLRVELEDWNRIKAYAKYGKFNIVTWRLVQKTEIMTDPLVTVLYAIQVPGGTTGATNPI